MVLTKSQARKIILHAAGLTKQGQFGRGKEAAYKVIDHLGFIQVDTNYVVERAHHHAIASRVPGYQTKWLEELQSEGRIYEFWTRDSGFMPMREFRYSLPVHEYFLSKWQPLSRPEINLMNRILDRISREGPLRARDFENDRVKKSSGWWDWRPSKVALERLHLTGQLLATRQKDFHKLYDLTDNIVPMDVDRTKPSVEEYTRHLIFSSLKSLGLAYANEIAWNGRHARHRVKDQLKELTAVGEIEEVRVEGLKNPLYMLPPYKKKKILVADDVFILSPFDTLNVFRKRLRDFFDFDYQIECFVPEAKRKYGYFSLPILAGDKFIARMDSKADRKFRILNIHNLHFEKGKITQATMKKLVDSVKDFAVFNGCDRVELVKCNDRHARQLIRKILV